MKGTHLGDPRPAAVVAVAVAVLALIFGGPRAVLLVAVVMVGANLTTLVLSETVSVARAGVHSEPDLWPSNHTTAVAAAGLCLLLIAPPRWRPSAALLAFGMAAGISLMLVMRGTHLLSDVVGGVLVAGLWAVVGAEVDAWMRKR